MRKVTERIIELGDKKELVTQEDLPYIVSDVLKHGIVDERVNLKKLHREPCLRTEADGYAENRNQRQGVRGEFQRRRPV